MKLEEFKRTRVTMTVEQYQAIYDGDFDIINKETAKMHVYKDGLYLRETLNGFLHNDLGDMATSPDLESMEECFWFEYAENFYNEEIKSTIETENDFDVSQVQIINMKDIKPGSIYTQEDKPDDIKHTPHPDSEVAHAMAEMYRQREHQPYTDEEYLHIAGNMETYGGSFFQFIGKALFKADQTNKRKLAEAFPEEFDKYLNFK